MTKGNFNFFNTKQSIAFFLKILEQLLADLKVRSFFFISHEYIILFTVILHGSIKNITIYTLML